MDKLTYNKAVDTLLDAYNRGELFHGNCDRCAVGNLLGTGDWGLIFQTNKNGFQEVYNSYREWLESRGLSDDSTMFSSLRSDRDNAIRVIETSGMTVGELMRIEHAFETSIILTKEGYSHWHIYDPRQGQLIGLRAVLDVMKDMVDEVVDNLADQKRLTQIYEKRNTLLEVESLTTS